MISAVIAAGSLLFAVGSSRPTSSALARFILEYNWHEPGTKITILSNPMVDSVSMLHIAKGIYDGDPDHAIEIVNSLGINNRILAEALLNGKLKYSIEGEAIVFSAPKPSEIIRGWTHRPAIFYALRNLAIRWRSGSPFDDDIYDDEQLQDRAEAIQDKAKAIVEWIQYEAKPRIDDIILAVKHIEWFLEQEKSPLVDPDNLDRKIYAETSQKAREWAVKFRLAWSR